MNSPDNATFTHDGPAQPPHAAVPRRHRNFFVAAILFTAAFMAVYEGHRASRQAQRAQVLAGRIQQLLNELDEAQRRLADASAMREPKLPAPPLQVTAQLDAFSTEHLHSTNLYARFENPPKLSAEQVEAYLKANGRKASTLLAAYRTSGDAALLKEAMEQFPNDPQVAFEAVFAKDLSAEERRQWLSAFEHNASDNALVNYLSARDYLKTGQTDQAVRQLMAAAGKPRFDDYTLARRQDDEEAYLAAGYSPAEAKMIASGQLLLPQLSELRQLGVQMVELSNSYRKAGDNASAQSILQMAASLGQSYSATDCAISHLVGLAIERIALGAMDPDSPFGNSGRTVREQLSQLNQQKAALSSFFKENESLIENMSEQDWIIYIDRDKMFGEEAALRWLVGKYGQK